MSALYNQRTNILMTANTINRIRCSISKSENKENDVIKRLLTQRMAEYANCFAALLSIIIYIYVYIQL